MEQSDMSLPLYMAKMAKEGYSRAAIDDTKIVMKKQRAEVRAEKKGVLEFPGDNKVKTAIQRNTAMLCRYLTSGCLPC